MYMYLSLPFLLCVCVLVRTQNRTTLHVGVLLELSDHWYSPYVGYYDNVLEYAFRQIEEREDILPGFVFKMTVKDTKGNNGLAAAQLIEMLEEGEPKIAVIGPTISGSLTITGQIVPVYNTMELSCVAVTATTVAKSLFPTLIKVNQGTELLSPFRIKLMEYFGWTRVGSIVYQDDISVSQMTMFHELLPRNNMTLVSSAVFSSISSIKGLIATFKEADIRIMMVAVHGSHAATLFCEAYKQELYGSSYVWILSAPTLHTGWLSPEGTTCTKEELVHAAEGHFTLNNLFMSLSEEPTITGKSPAEEMNILKEMIKSTSHTWSTRNPWVFDTAWSLAIGLNNSLPHLEAMNLSLHNYTYSKNFLNALMTGMKEVNFSGVSGPVSFQDGNRRGLTYMEKHTRNGSTLVAYYDVTTDILSWTVNPKSLWQNGIVPKDRFIYREYIVNTSLPAVVSVVVLNCVGFLMSLAFMTFNIYYRNKRTIKMSSPMISNVIILGCILMYSEVFVNAVDNFNPNDYDAGGAICMTRTWLISLAFTLLFGALFAKTYRIYIMFREYRVRNKFIKDRHLFAVIGILLLVDIVILVPWTLLFPLQTRHATSTIKDPSNNNIILYEVYLYCYHPLETYWVLTMYVYKGLLLAFGVFLAWETRKVTVMELNDSKYIGACIYNVVVICIFGVPLAHVLPIEQKTLTFVLESCLIFFCTTICQCILFIPKIQGRNKVFGKMLVRSDMTQTITLSTADALSTIDAKALPSGEAKSCDVVDRNEKKDKEGLSNQIDKTNKLESENKELRHQIAKEAIAVAKLKKSILSITGNTHFYRSGDEYIVFQRTGAPAETVSTNNSTNNRQSKC